MSTTATGPANSASPTSPTSPASSKSASVLASGFGSRRTAKPASRARETAPLANGKLEKSAEQGLTDAAEIPSVSTDAVTAEAAESVIEAKRIGERIKHLRQRKGMGLVELGRYTALSASFLSQLETGRVVPTLRNLARIAMVFSRDLQYFFEAEPPELFRIVRASERQRLPQTGVDDPGYFYESLGVVPGIGSSGGHRVAPYVAEFLPATGQRLPRSHQHAGSEFLYILSGCLKLTHAGKEDTFEAGDAVYFAASATHSYERLGDEPCTALIVTMPETANAARAARASLAAPAKL